MAKAGQLTFIEAMAIIELKKMPTGEPVAFAMKWCTADINRPKKPGGVEKNHPTCFLIGSDFNSDTIRVHLFPARDMKVEVHKHLIMEVNGSAMQL